MRANNYVAAATNLRWRTHGNALERVWCIGTTDDASGMVCRRPDGKSATFIVPLLHVLDDRVLLRGPSYQWEADALARVSEESRAAARVVSAAEQHRRDIEHRIAAIGAAEVARRVAPAWGYQNPRDAEARLSRWRADPDHRREMNSEAFLALFVACGLAVVAADRG
jgi:hypothetical protein